MTIGIISDLLFRENVEVLLFVALQPCPGAALSVASRPSGRPTRASDFVETSIV